MSRESSRCIRTMKNIGFSITQESFVLLSGFHCSESAKGDSEMRASLIKIVEV